MTTITEDPGTLDEAETPEGLAQEAPLDDRHTLHTKDACETNADVEMNEGIPTKPLPTQGLPYLPTLQTEENGQDGQKENDGRLEKRETKDPAPPRKDGMEKALEILDEYYKDTPERDPRFHNDEE